MISTTKARLALAKAPNPERSRGCGSERSQGHSRREFGKIPPWWSAILDVRCRPDADVTRKSR
jgi:hypothetical protein